MAKEKENQVPKEITQYLQALMIEKGSDKLPPNVQADIMAELYQNLNNYFLVNVAKNLNDKQYQEFNDLLNSEATEAEIQSFIRENTDYQKVIGETLEEFRDIYLGKNKK